MNESAVRGSRAIIVCQESERAEAQRTHSDNNVGSKACDVSVRQAAARGPPATARQRLPYVQ